MNTNNQKLDILAFGAHPDDVEVGAGGLVYKWSQKGRKVGLVDLSRGESSTNGSVEERKKEARKSRDILGATVRDQLNMPCGFIETNKENILHIIKTIRKYQPKIILAPYWQDRHSDHVETSRLVTRAAFRSNLKKIDTKQEPHKPDKVFYYSLHHDFGPDFVVDISEEFEVKMQSINAHESQFHCEDGNDATHINSGDFLEFVEARAKFYGFKIGARYGEPYAVADGYIGIDEPENFRLKAI